jgi:hypothetical protein|tara:strand:- start:7721 stop:7924 length:204 start_codon:yes stop_codon:yes gene_type:complete
MDKANVKKKLNRAVDKVSRANTTIRAKAAKTARWIKVHPKTVKAGVVAVVLATAVGVGYLLGKKSSK